MKRFFSIFLCVAMIAATCIAFCACGNRDNGKTAGENSENGENGDENGESREVTTPIATTAGGKTAIFNHLQTTIILHRITKRPCM